MAVEQTLGSDLHTIIGGDAEDDVFRVGGQALDQGGCFRIIENVERLLFENHLREIQNVLGQFARRASFRMMLKPLTKPLGDDFGAGFPLCSAEGTFEIPDRSGYGRQQLRQ